jgi:peroxiredoxin family protein
MAEFSPVAPLPVTNFPCETAQGSTFTGDSYREMEQRLEHRLERLEELLARQPDANKMNLVIFDNSLDRLMASLVIATSSAACGIEVSMFFTFWGTSALKRDARQVGRKSLIERAFGWMLPRGYRHAKLSRMNMGGIGKALMAREMHRKQIVDLDTLFTTAAELGVRISVCDMSMRLMGIRREELIDYPNLSFCGATTFAEAATTSNTTLFI